MISNERKLLSFFYNENISIVKQIFQNKVDGVMFYHLVDRAEKIATAKNNNTWAWNNFYLDLDNSNEKILLEYIHGESEKPSGFSILKDQKVLISNLTSSQVEEFLSNAENLDEYQVGV